MLLQSKIFRNYEQRSHLSTNHYGQKNTKHFSPTAALILQKEQFANAEEKADLAGKTLKSITFSKIRAGLTQPFIPTNENLLMKNKGLPQGQKIHFSNAFFGLNWLLCLFTK